MLVSKQEISAHIATMGVESLALATHRQAPFNPQWSSHYGSQIFLLIFLHCQPARSKYAMITLYHILDVFFFVFHIALILFNLFGWIFKPLRKWNLITLAITAFSWVVLGIFFGFGYCFLTDWHWQIREKLGHANPYNSYIHFLVETVFGVRVSSTLVDWCTGIFFAAALTMSLSTNFALFRMKNKTG